MTQSVYLSTDEVHAVREVARLNGVAVNFVLRVALHRLLGWPTVELATPSTRDASLADRGDASRLAGA